MFECENHTHLIGGERRITDFFDVGLDHLQVPLPKALQEQDVAVELDPLAPSRAGRGQRGPLLLAAPAAD